MIVTRQARTSLALTDHCLWAGLIARIYEVFPLLCPMCGGPDAADSLSITEGAQTKRILEHIGVDPEPPHMSPARGPPLWDDWGDAQRAVGAAHRTSPGGKGIAHHVVA